MRPRRPSTWSLISALAVVVVGAYVLTGAALLLNPPSLDLARHPQIALTQAAVAVAGLTVRFNP
jgi:hypothetical protein